MQLCIFTEPQQGATYQSLLTTATAAEDLGFDGLAVAVAGLDAMSDGRVELGIGTGWYEAAHRAYGIPFPSLAERRERSWLPRDAKLTLRRPRPLAGRPAAAAAPS
jgi:Luciferase-like monooxygenase